MLQLIILIAYLAYIIITFNIIKKFMKLSSLFKHEHKSAKNHHSKSRGYRVSFADDISHSQLAEGDKARDGYEGSSLKPVFSTPVLPFEVNILKIKNSVKCKQQDL